MKGSSKASSTCRTVAEKAKIFLSAGRYPVEKERPFDEMTLTDTIKDRLSQDYEVYLALAEQTTESVVDGIFDNLKTSEYYLFIDYKREDLGGDRGRRGSLFTNQELAVAKTLGMPIIAFQEKGVRLEGVLEFIKANSKQFDDRKTLVDNPVSSVPHKIPCGRGQVRRERVGFRLYLIPKDPCNKTQHNHQSNKKTQAAQSDAVEGYLSCQGDDSEVYRCDDSRKHPRDPTELSISAIKYIECSLDIGLQ